MSYIFAWRRSPRHAAHPRFRARVCAYLGSGNKILYFEELCVLCVEYMGGHGLCRRSTFLLCSNGAPCGMHHVLCLGKLPTLSTLNGSSPKTAMLMMRHCELVIARSSRRSLRRARRARRRAARRYSAPGWKSRRSQTSETPPGEYFLTAWQTLSVLSAVAGAAIGISVAAAVLLTYRGDEPVNVAWFFACTVGIQWLILAAALGIWLLRRTTHLFENFHPLRKLLSGLLWSLSTALHRLPGERREHIRARLMGIRRKGEVFELLLWPLLMITQIFGVFFNVGCAHRSLAAFGQGCRLRVAIDS